jgi:hypothetical protein
MDVPRFGKGVSEAKSFCISAAILQCRVSVVHHVAVGIANFAVTRTNRYASVYNKCRSSGTGFKSLNVDSL